MFSGQATDNWRLITRTSTQLSQWSSLPALKPSTHCLHWSQYDVLWYLCWIAKHMNYCLVCWPFPVVDSDDISMFQARLHETRHARCIQCSKSQPIQMIWQPMSHFESSASVLLTSNMELIFLIYHPLSSIWYEVDPIWHKHDIQ